MELMESHKKGTTLSWRVFNEDDAGLPATLAGITIKSQLRKGNFEHTLTVDIIDEAGGEFLISATPDEQNFWPITTVACDILFIEGGIVTATETFELPIINAVTSRNA